MASVSVANVRKDYGNSTVLEDVSLELADGEFMVIVGPSGCGKSTLLRIIAGVETLTSGEVRIGERVVTYVHPRSRNVAMVFQDYALYPHMSVAKNLSFGLRARGVARAEAEEKVRQTSAVLAIDHLLPRKPAQLSGGERQRVALGRAMIRNPDVYLMDEPLSNLDAALRVQMRGELIEFHRRMRATIVYVTHDQVEAMTMGSRIAVVKSGRLQQVGPPREVYRRPANEFVATFLGSPRMNVLPAALEVRGRTVEIRHEELRWSLPRHVLPDDLPHEARVGFRPEAIVVGDDRTDSEAAHMSRGADYVEHLGNEVIAHLAGAGGVPLVARIPAARAERALEGARYSIAARDLHLFDTETGAAIYHGSEVTSELESQHNVTSTSQ